MLVTGGVPASAAGLQGPSQDPGPDRHGHGKAEESGIDGSNLTSKLTSAVAGVLQDDPRQPGCTRSRSRDPARSQALQERPHGRYPGRVLKLDGQGSETVVWESKTYGENSRSRQGRADRRVCQPPLEIDCPPATRSSSRLGPQGILFDRRELKMALPEPGVFPLASGTHALGVTGEAGRSSTLK